VHVQLFGFDEDLYDDAIKITIKKIEPPALQMWFNISIANR